MENTVIVTRKIGFTFELDNEFSSISEAENYIDGIIKRITKANIKAKKDNRPNSYGIQCLPWFEINGSIYYSEFDNRNK